MSTDRSAEPGAAPDFTPQGLVELGWSSTRTSAFTPFALAGLVPGRVTSSGGVTIAVTPAGRVEVVLQRRGRDLAAGTQRPIVGDWLALEPISLEPPTAALRSVLPRGGSITRNGASGDGAQVLAANVDVAFIVSGLDHDLKLRRLERYLVLAFDGGVRPVVVLNKADIAADLESAVSGVQRIAAGTRVIVASAVRGDGIDELRRSLPSGSTGCLLGSSGVGKSSIMNALLGVARQDVRELRQDDSKGRHTTTRRELFRLPGAGLLIDTPGLRTVGVTSVRDGLATTFADVDRLARDCRFADCGHAGEPGCAVQAALDDGRLDQDRLASHRKLEAEAHWLRTRDDTRARRATERRFGRLYRSVATDHRRSRGED